MGNVRTQYFREIKKLIPGGSSARKQCLTELNHSIITYLHDNPTATIDDLHKKYGTPQAIAESYMEQNPKQYSRNASLKRHIIMVAISVSIVILAVVYIASKSISEDINEVQEGYYIIDIDDHSTSTHTPPRQ